MENNKFLDRCKSIGRAVKDKIKYAVTCLSVMFSMALVTGGPVTVLAGNTKDNGADNTKGKGADDFNFLKEGDGNGAFDGLTKTVKATGRSGMNLMTAIGIVGIVFAIICAGLTLMLKKGGKREEGKESLEYIAIGGIFVFGAVGIGAMIAGVGSSIGGK